MAYNLPLSGSCYRKKEVCDGIENPRNMNTNARRQSIRDETQENPIERVLSQEHRHKSFPKPCLGPND